MKKDKLIKQKITVKNSMKQFEEDYANIDKVIKNPTLA